MPQRQVSATTKRANDGDAVFGRHGALRYGEHRHHGFLRCAELAWRSQISTPHVTLHAAKRETKRVIAGSTCVAGRFSPLPCRAALACASWRTCGLF